MQAGLFFIPLLGFLAMTSAMQKVQEVHQQELQTRFGVDAMWQSFKKLKIDAEARKDLTGEMQINLKKMEEDLRYLSPAKNAEAHSYESDFVDEANKLADLFSEPALRQESVLDSFEKCSRLISYRKNVYSN